MVQNPQTTQHYVLFESINHIDRTLSLSLVSNPGTNTLSISARSRMVNRSPIFFSLSLPLAYLIADFLTCSFVFLSSRLGTMCFFVVLYRQLKIVNYVYCLRCVLV
jgi:hypothetical protein